MLYETNLALRCRRCSDDQNELMHYGISGQKWGIRRYQNKDGSLTPLGKEHYAVSSGGNAAFDRKYTREVKKFQKWDNRADTEKQQMERDTRYAKAQRAAKAAGVGLGLAVAGAGLPGTRKAKQHVSNKAWVDIPGAGSSKAFDASFDMDVTRPGIGAYVFYAGLATMAGAGAVYAKNKIQGALAEKYTTVAGHTKAVKRREQQYKKMLKTFEGTSYEQAVKELNDKMKKYS